MSKPKVQHLRLVQSHSDDGMGFSLSQLETKIGSDVGLNQNQVTGIQNLVGQASQIIGNVPAPSVPVVSHTVLRSGKGKMTLSPQALQILGYFAIGVAAYTGVYMILKPRKG